MQELLGFTPRFRSESNQGGKKNYTQKTIRYWWKKLTMKQINAKICHAHGLDELMLK